MHNTIQAMKLMNFLNNPTLLNVLKYKRVPIELLIARIIIVHTRTGIIWNGCSFLSNAKTYHPLQGPSNQ